MMIVPDDLPAIGIVALITAFLIWLTYLISPTVPTCATGLTYLARESICVHGYEPLRK